MFQTRVVEELKTHISCSIHFLNRVVYGIMYINKREIFILVINQLDAQNFCFTISLFQASTCFEHHVLIIRRSKLYYTTSGIITPIGVL